MYITVIGYIIWAFGILVAIWYIFPSFWYIVPRKIWQPWLVADKNELLFDNEIKLENRGKKFCYNCSDFAPIFRRNIFEIFYVRRFFLQKMFSVILSNFPFPDKFLNFGSKLFSAYRNSSKPL
jgi:hypothetical protein